MPDQNGDNLFQDAESVPQVMGMAVGAASVCWNPPPTGEFDSEQANNIVNDALARMMVLMGFGQADDKDEIIPPDTPMDATPTD